MCYFLGVVLNWSPCLHSQSSLWKTLLAAYHIPILPASLATDPGFILGSMHPGKSTFQPPLLLRLVNKLEMEIVGWDFQEIYIKGSRLSWECIVCNLEMDGSPALILDYRITEAMPKDQKAGRRNSSP